MEGVDIHLDVNVGKQLSALGHTLTTLTGYEDDESINLDSDSDEVFICSLLKHHKRACMVVNE
jgi:hypothetical protein